MIKMELDKRALAQFKRALKEYEKKTGIGIEEAIIDMARSTGRRLAHTVPPFGMSPSVGKKFIESIETQVDYAWYGSTRGVYPSTSMEAAHAAARNSRGQVRMRKFRRAKEFNQNISVAEKETYKRKVIKKAGLAKAGWIAAAEKIISKQSTTKRGKQKKITGVPKWIREDVKESIGQSSTKKQGISTSVDLTNKVRYISNLQKPSHIQKAIKQGYQNAIKRIGHIVSGKRRNTTI